MAMMLLLLLRCVLFRFIANERGYGYTMGSCGSSARINLLT